MPGRIPPSLLGKAQQVLSQTVIEQMTAKPNARLPDDVWAQLSKPERAMVLELRKGVRDGFEPDAAPVERTRSTGERSVATPFAGNDPIAGAAPAAQGLNPNTGLDPQAMHEIFGGVVDTTGLETFEGQGLIDELRKRFFSHHVTLDYSTARQRMFTEVDNDGGQVDDVYANRTLNDVHGIPKAEGPNGFNTEHTWPQSKLKAAGKPGALSDLHHLFPVESFANGKRGHVPFGWVQTVQWENKASGAKLGEDAHGQVVFTPPEKHRGDVARALFWISTAYQLHIPNDEEAVLKQWAHEDPVSDKERSRNEKIAKVQGDLNPYVVIPELADKVQDF